MRKKYILWVLLFLVLYAIILNTLCTYLWGYNTIINPDELRIYDRAKLIALHKIQLNRVWNAPNIYDLYPAGLHLFIASFILLTNNQQSVFSISLLFRILLSLIPTYLSFLIGLKFSKKVAAFSAFFYITSMIVLTKSDTYYITLYSYSNVVSTGAITRITVLISLLTFLIPIKENKESINSKYGILFLLSASIHGASHISTYLGFVFNFSALFLILFIYAFLTGKKYLERYSAFYMFLTFLSVIFVFFIYYFPMYKFIIQEPYSIGKLLPKFLPEFFIDYLPIVLLGLTIVTLFLLFAILKYSKGVIFKPTKLVFGRRIVSILILNMYIILYIVVLYLVTKNPLLYVYDFTLIFSPFPTYIPRHIPSFISVLSLVAGFTFYSISVYAIHIIFKKEFLKDGYLIIYIYIIFFVIWFIFGFVVSYYASRIIYIQYILPFILAIGISKIIPKYKIGEIKLKNLVKILLVLFIIAIISSSNVLSVANKDPVIRYSSEIQNNLIIGKVNDPIVTYDFMIYLNYYSSNDEYILGSKNSIEAVFTIVDFKSPTTTFVRYYKNNSGFSIVFLALKNPTKTNLERVYKTNYPTRFLIVGYNEMFPFKQPLPIKKYDSSPNLIKIYQGQGNQRIYLIAY